MAGDRTDSAQQLDTKRLSISVPRAVYQELEAQAARNNVSLAWVVRKALSEYLDRDIPLLRTGN
jgi:metal-responsive CopG/Arc/MetJ family transcriptional regulator